MVSEQLVHGHMGAIREIQASHEDFLGYLTDMMAKIYCSHCSQSVQTWRFFVPSSERDSWATFSDRGDEGDASSSKDEMTISQ